MGEFQYKAGLHNVGNYQISGVPYVTGNLTAPANNGTPLEVIFPSVTQVVKIHNHNGTQPLKVGFSAAGVSGSNHWLVDAESASGNSYIELRVKTDRIFLLSNTATQVTGVYVAAELTGITLDYNLAAALSGTSGIG